MHPPNPGGMQPYTPITGVVGTPQAIPNRHPALQCWSFAIPNAAGTYDFVTPANITAEVMFFRFKRSTVAGHAADNYQLQRGADVIGDVTPGGAANAVGGPLTMNRTFTRFTPGSTLRIVVTDGGAGNLDGVLDVYWVRD